MKTLLRHMTCLLLMTALLFAAGCNLKDQDKNGKNESAEKEQIVNTASDSYEYSESIVFFPDPSKARLVEKGGWHTTVDGIVYNFTNKVAEDERNTAVREISTMIRLIRDQFNLGDMSVSVRIRKGSYSPGFYDGVLVSGTDELKTQAFTASLVQMMLDNHISYSLCYGLGTELAQELGYAVEETTALENALTLCETSLSYLDMNYACFLPVYADEETLPKVKSLALAFYNSLTEDMRLELFTNYTSELFRQQFNNYLISQGQEPYNNTEMDDIFIYPCGGDVRLAWADAYSNFYLYDAFEVKGNTHDLTRGTTDLLNSGYENFRYVAVSYCRQAAEMERLVGHLEGAELESKPNVLLIRDGTFENTYGGGCYREDVNEIRIYELSCYIHEYTHYLTRYGTKEAWLQELLANYCMTYRCEPALYRYLDWFRGAYLGEYELNADTAREYGEFYAKVQSQLNHPFDWSSRQDLITFFNARIVFYQLMDQVTGLTHNYTLASFANYLATLTDETTALQAIYENAPGKYLDKSWDELVADWNTWISSEYAWILE